jgi:hypothetical protein
MEHFFTGKVFEIVDDRPHKKKGLKMNKWLQILLGIFLTVGSIMVGMMIIILIEHFSNTGGVKQINPERKILCTLNF